MIQNVLNISISLSMAKMHPKAPCLRRCGVVPSTSPKTALNECEQRNCSPIELRNLNDHKISINIHKYP